MADHICVAFPTIMDGMVLRWYVDQAAWDRSDCIASASRNYFVAEEGCPDEIRKLADQGHSYLTVEYAAHWTPKLDVSRWVTHRHRQLFSRELDPVATTNPTTTVRNDFKEGGASVDE